MSEAHPPSLSRSFAITNEVTYESCQEALERLPFSWTERSSALIDVARHARREAAAAARACFGRQEMSRLTYRLGIKRLIRSREQKSSCRARRRGAKDVSADGARLSGKGTDAADEH